MNSIKALAPMLVFFLVASNMTLYSSGSSQSSVVVQSAGKIGSKHEPEDGRCYLGAWLGEDAINPERVRAKIPWWNQLTGKGLGWYAIIQNFGPSNASEPLLIVDQYKPLVQEGLFGGVVLTWQPAFNFDLEATGEACIADIAAGKYDSFVRSEARRCRDTNYPIIIRFGHEMNGYWMGWGNNPAQFKQAWIRIVQLFREEGATNVAWLWCPNYSDSPAARRFQDYYPSDEYVDYVGIDAYANPDWAWWADPGKQFGNPSGNVYDTYSAKPFIVGEWGCSSELTEGQNAVYVGKFFDAVESRVRVKAIIHWHGDGWKLSLYPQALEVYKERVNSTRYLEHV